MAQEHSPTTTLCFGDFRTLHLRPWMRTRMRQSATVAPVAEGLDEVGMVTNSFHNIIVAAK